MTRSPQSSNSIALSTSPKKFEVDDTSSSQQPSSSSSSTSTSGRSSDSIASSSSTLLSPRPSRDQTMATLFAGLAIRKTGSASSSHSSETTPLLNGSQEGPCYAYSYGNRYQGVNLYVKNLDAHIDDERLHKEFAPFGKITSTKVMTDGNGRSKGFGFVSFSSPEEAFRAISVMNGRIVVSKALYVALAQRKEERKAHLASQHMQRRAEIYRQCCLMCIPPSANNLFPNETRDNLYVKNLDAIIDDARLHTEFAPFGKITSAKVMTDGNGHSKGFGFVRFSSPEEANRAISVMNGRIVVSKPLYVALALRKKERKAHLASQYMKRRAEIYRQHCLMCNSRSANNLFPNEPQAQRSYFPQMAQIRDKDNGDDDENDNYKNVDD